MSKEMEMSVVVEGNGKTKQAAFVSAISSLQNKIAGQTDGTVIRIEPLDVSFIEGKETRFTEKFLFFFMKREISNFTLKLNVKVRIIVVDHNSFPFELIDQTKKLFR